MFIHLITDNIIDYTAKGFKLRVAMAWVKNHLNIESRNIHDLNVLLFIIKLCA